MSTINKNSSKSHEESVNQQHPSSSFLSNYRWWLLSFVSIVLVAFAVQQRRSDSPQKQPATERLFTADELRTFTKDELYLAILGHVFNVSSASRFYSATGSYGFYTGRDASRSFHTGGTSPEDLTDDLTGLTDEAMAGVYGWLTFYKKQYPAIGKLIGRFFSADGSPTEHFARVLTAVEIMKRKEEEKSRSDQKWPPCNSEWSHAAGKRVWCSEKSGGIERSWIGVPRRLFDSVTQTERCICLENASQMDGRLKEYPNCLSTSAECQVVD